MSIIFQLFHADDLRSLSKNELQRIFVVIQNNKGLLNTTLDESLNPGINGAQHRNHLAPLNEADEKRRQVVFQQLGLRESTAPRLRNIGNRQPNQVANEEEKKFLILAWAIDCEEGNRKFFDALKTIRDKAYDEYRAITQVDPKSPDSLYSPFNPRGPLYRLYNPGPHSV